MKKLEIAIGNFKKVQKKFEKAGATDTEPDWYWQYRIRMILKGEPIKNPPLQDWDVFSRTAEKALEDAFLSIEKILEEYMKIHTYLKDICYRVDFNF